MSDEPRGFRLTEPCAVCGTKIDLRHGSYVKVERYRIEESLIGDAVALTTAVEVARFCSDDHAHAWQVEKARERPIPGPPT